MFRALRRRLRQVQASFKKKDSENEPRVSFIVPCWNMAFDIPQTINSLLDQTLKEIEIIVVDDGSTDHLVDLINHYSSKDKRVKYRAFFERGGAARCRNAGNKMAVAPIICVCDAGDVYTKWRAEVVYKYFKKHKKVDVLCCACIHLGDDELETCVMPRKYQGKLGERLKFEHPAVAYRREVAIRWPYREDCLDTDQYDAFFFTLGKNGIKFGISDRIVTAKATRVIYSGGRDLNKARMKKLEIYREFKIDIPKWLLEFEKNYREFCNVSHD